MPRDRRHFILNGLSKSEKFRPKGQPSTKHPSDVADRPGHAQALLQAIDHLPDVKAEGTAGVYIDVAGRAGEIMVTTGLNASDLTLLRFEPGQPAANQPPRATVFATGDGVAKLRRKIEDFAHKNRTKKDGTEGRPYNADLVQSIGAIVEAGLRALWRSPAARFPEGDGAVPWELWLDKTKAAAFIENAPEYGVAVGADRLEFPEDIVVIATAARGALALAVRRLGGVRALAAPSITADYFDAMPIEKQADWLDNLSAWTTFQASGDPSYVTLLDRGVSRAHPLIESGLSADDRHAADPAWDVTDFVGHGTQLAGLALYGDLTLALQTMLPIEIRHRLESAKIIPDAGHNPHHLLGALTRAGTNAAEATGDRRRTFALASTTEEDTPHDGAPTSWSSEVDQLTAGVSGIKKTGMEHGLKLASALGARATVLTVSEPLSPDAALSAQAGGIKDPAARYDQQIDDRMKERFAIIEQRASAHGVSVAFMHEIDDSPAEAIVRFAKLRDCDLIVMSSHGRRGARRFILGSQTAEVVTTTTIPVLVVR